MSVTLEIALPRELAELYGDDLFSGITQVSTFSLLAVFLLAAFF